MQKRLEIDLCLLSALVKFGNGQSRQLEAVGQKHQFPVAIPIMVDDPPQMIGVLVFGLGSGQPDGLVADHAGRAVHRMGTDFSPAGVGLGAQQEKAAEQVHQLKSLEIQPDAVHAV